MTYRDDLRERLKSVMGKALDIVIKTQGFYDQAITTAVRDFYHDKTDAFDFIDKMVYLITEQFTRAWNEGMRNIGLDPKEDMEPEWEEVLQDRIEQEIDAVEKFAGDIEAAAADKENNPIAPLLARVSMWSNRYNELVSLAVATCGRNKLEWVLGEAEHCETCLRLSGCVDWSENWSESGWLPQTNMLRCGGFKCQCSLVPTNKRRTPGGVWERMDGYQVTKNVKYSDDQPRDDNGRWTSGGGGGGGDTGGGDSDSNLPTGVSIQGGISGGDQSPSGKREIRDQRGKLEEEIINFQDSPGRTEMINAVRNYNADVLIYRNNSGVIGAAASYEKLDNGDIKIINMGSVQGGAGIVLTSAFKDMARSSGVSLIAEARIQAREFWERSGFVLKENSANVYIWNESLP